MISGRSTLQKIRSKQCGGIWPQPVAIRRRRADISTRNYELRRCTKTAKEWLTISPKQNASTEQFRPFPSARLHFAIANIEGRGVPRDYVEAYKLLLLADKTRSWHPPSRKQVETDPQRHRENRRHIRVRELMATLESELPPEQLLRAREAAREWWNTHR